MGVILRWTARLALAGLAVLAATLGAVIWQDRALTAETAEGRALAGPVEVAIVLGAGVSGDGRLAYGSRRRVAAGVGLLERGLAERLVFSGGLGGNHPDISAAELMRAHAVELGAAPERLLIEPRAISTFENLRFSFEIAEREGVERLAIVSDGYHLTRASWIAAFWGRPDLAVVAAQGFERQWWPHRGVHYVRESLAWWLHLAKVAGWEGLGLLGMPEAARGAYVR